MKTRRPLAVLAATAITGLGLTALATPASASTEVTVTGTADEPVFTENSVTGTSFTLTNNLDSSYVWIKSPEISASPNFETPCSTGCQLKAEDGNRSRTFYIAPGTNGLDVTVDTSNASNVTGVFTVTYLGESNPSNDSASGSTPAPRIQQFEKPATGTCNEAQPEGLNWGGASSGGWGESWAKWANEGQGGTVCTRTLAYNNSTATWQVQ